jgi:predicted transglutaminase-like protease
MTRSYRVYKALKLLKIFALIATTIMLVLNKVALFMDCSTCPGHDQIWINIALLVTGILMKIFASIGFIALIVHNRQQYRIMVENPKIKMDVFKISDRF